jgi:hypothetical protein
MNACSDFVVVGAGIAGLAVAELLQRSGASVVLLDRESRVCACASAEQQGWFHTGALYSALPTNFSVRTMVGNLDDLIDYYSSFANMNLRVTKHVSAASREGWFDNRTNFYAFEGWSKVGWAWKLPWVVALYRARRRMSWFENLDASRSLSRQAAARSRPTGFVEHPASLGLNLGPLAFALKSRDRAMDTRLIAADLLQAFIASKGDLRLETEVIEISRGVVTARSTRTGEVRRLSCRHIVVTTGKNAGAFGSDTKVLVSPLLVVAPALSDINFVRMSPHMDRTINHVVHRVDGVSYSVIGNAVYYPATHDTAEKRVAAGRRMIELAENVFGPFGDRGARVFFGFKTEIASSSRMRNYLYHIVQRDTYTLALPGKFTLCFSLAVNVCRHFGLDPIECVIPGGADVSALVEQPTHRRLARELLAEHLAEGLHPDVRAFDALAL